MSTTVLISVESTIPASDTSNHCHQDLLPPPVPGTSRQDDSPSASVPQNSHHNDIQPIANANTKKRRQNSNDDMWNLHLQSQIDQAHSVIDLNKSKKTLVDLQVLKLQFDMAADVDIIT